MAKAFVALALLAIVVGSVAEIGEEENVGVEELELIEEDPSAGRREWIVEPEEMGGEVIWTDQSEVPSEKKKQVVVTEWGSGWPHGKTYFRKNSKKVEKTKGRKASVWDSPPELKVWDWMSENKGEKRKTKTKAKKPKKDVSVTNWGFPTQNSWDWINEAHNPGKDKKVKEVTMWGFPPGTTWNWDWPDEPVEGIKPIENIEADIGNVDDDWGNEQGKGWNSDNEDDRDLDNDDQEKEDFGWRNDDNGRDEDLFYNNDNDDRDLDDRDRDQGEDNGDWDDQGDTKKANKGWSRKTKPKINDDLGLDDKLKEGLEFLRQKAADIENGPGALWSPISPPLGWKPSADWNDSPKETPWKAIKSPIGWSPRNLEKPRFKIPSEFKAPAKWSPPEIEQGWSPQEKSNDKENIGWGREQADLKEPLDLEPVQPIGWSPADSGVWQPKGVDEEEYDQPDIKEQPEIRWSTPDVEPIAWSQPESEKPDEKENSGWGREEKAAWEPKEAEEEEYERPDTKGPLEQPEYKAPVRWSTPEVKEWEQPKESHGWLRDRLNPEKDNLGWSETPEKESGGGWEETPVIKENIGWVETPEIKENAGWVEALKVKENVGWVETPEVKENGGWSETPVIKENVGWSEGPEIKDTTGWSEGPEIKENIGWSEGPQTNSWQPSRGPPEKENEGWKEEWESNKERDEENQPDTKDNSGWTQPDAEPIAWVEPEKTEEKENSGWGHEENPGLSPEINDNLGWSQKSPERPQELGNGWEQGKGPGEKEPGNGWEQGKGPEGKEPGSGWEAPQKVPVGWQGRTSWKPEFAEQVKKTPELISDVAWKKAVNQALGFKEQIQPARGIKHLLRRKHNKLIKAGLDWKKQQQEPFEWKLLANGRWVKIRKGLVSRININGKWFRVSKEIVSKPGARKIKVIKTISSHLPPPSSSQHSQPATGARRVNVNTKPEVSRVWGKVNGAFPKVNAGLQKFITDLGWKPVRGGWEKVPKNTKVKVSTGGWEKPRQNQNGDHGKVKESSGWVTNQEPKVNTRWEKLLGKIVHRGIGPKSRYHQRGREGIVFKKGFVFEGSVHKGGIQAKVKVGVNSNNNNQF